MYLVGFKDEWQNLIYLEDENFIVISSVFTYQYARLPQYFCQVILTSILDLMKNSCYMW